MKINSIYRSTHEKFLKAIDHMEFHPTLGRPKTKPGVRLKRAPQNNREAKMRSYLEQIKTLTGEDA